MTQKMNRFDTKPKIISYRRWRTGQQAYGDSKRRQDKNAVKWLRENGFEADPNEVLEDSGLSGYHQENFGENGALGQFIKRVHEGIYPKGTVLLIEEFSRFSRAQVQIAQQRFLDLLNSGIVIVMVNDQKIYQGQVDTVDLIISLSKMESAYSESKRKSDQLLDFWQGKREEALSESSKEKEVYPVLLPSNAPDWLRKIEVDGQKVFDIIVERRKVVERIVISPESRSSFK